MADIRDEVRKRVGGCCEYCRISDALVSTPFQLDHIIADKHGGPTSLENLSWSCLDCNSFKGPNIAGRDDNQTVRLFDPRKDDWKEHFDWNGPILVGRLTPRSDELGMWHILIAAARSGMQACKLSAEVPLPIAGRQKSRLS